MFRVRELIFVCVATSGLVFILGCPPPPPPPPPCASDNDCDDGFYCNGEETCVNGQCIGGTDPCSTGQVCNEEQKACSSDPPPPRCSPGETCDDGLFCTATDTCSNGTCVGIGDPCPGQMCNENTEACVNCLVHADCDDGNACTEGLCYNGECQHLLIECRFACDDKLGCISETPVPCPGPFTCAAPGYAGVTVVSKWTKREITYQLQGGRDAAAATVASLYRKAASQWSDLIPLDIRPARPGETVDIAVQLCEQDDTEPACDALTDTNGILRHFPFAGSEVAILPILCPRIKANGHADGNASV